MAYFSPPHAFRLLPPPYILQASTAQLLKEGEMVDAAFEDKVYDPKMFEVLKVSLGVGR